MVDECEGNGKVVILNDEAEEVNTYTGSKLTDDNKFTPENITATASDIVIITEPNEHNIYFLTDSGQYITHYNTEHINMLYPCSLYLATPSELYIGCKSHKSRTENEKIYRVRLSM